MKVHFPDKYRIESDGAGLIDVARAGGVVDGDGGKVAVKDTETPISDMYLTVLSLYWLNAEDAEPSIDNTFLF